ncbi:hypothetical protein HOU04_gp082 [Synechococcus phage S-T4]|uniref:Uncharacterized protein n=1 Tax=Synechococcus phage S-T4 TaxID=2268578 RepID=A0A385EF30_9CAUD|nr:hypothetical protein HOU04_gp082 [Synechococcus phage S-T4]AXQ70481.1 hypothetical protein [Synechococcus phage S-T4]
MKKYIITIGEKQHVVYSRASEWFVTESFLRNKTNLTNYTVRWTNC